MGNPALTADRGVERRARAVGTTTALDVGPAPDNQLMLGLYRIYYNELYVREVKEAYRQFQRRTQQKPAVAVAESITPDWLRKRFENFLRVNEAALLPLLQRQGWDSSKARTSGYLAAFRDVIGNWFATLYQTALPTPNSIDFDPTIAAHLSARDWYVGRQSGYNERVRRQNAQRALQTAENIAAGPVGALGYLLGGDAGSDMGALVDGAIGAGGRAAEARSQFKTMSQPPDQRAVAGEVAKGTSSRGTETSSTAAGPIAPKRPPAPPAKLRSPPPPPASEPSDTPAERQRTASRRSGAANAGWSRSLAPPRPLTRAEAHAESMAWWQQPGTTTKTRFARHEQDFRSIFATMRNLAKSRLGKSLGLKAPNERVLTELVDQLILGSKLAGELQAIKRDAARDPKLRAELSDFLEGKRKAGAGTVDKRRTDVVEFYVDSREVVVTDYTENPSRVHKLKTGFYGLVMTKMLGPDWRVYSLDYNLKTGEADVRP